jgi:polar amino acid transport system substrate-binding protein
MKVTIQNLMKWVAGAVTLTIAVGVSAPVLAADLTNLVPGRYKTNPVVIGTTATMPPVESVDTATGKVIGFEADLAYAIGKKLGVKVEIQNVAFDGLLAGMQSGRFDIAMSGLADTVQRQQAMDFVDWYVSGVQLIVAKGNPKRVKNLETLCGLTLGGVRDATEYRVMQAVAARCTQNTPLIPTENSPAGMILVKTGRVDVFCANFPSGARYVQANPDLELIPGQFKVVNRGVAFAKTNTQLRDAWREGLKAIIESGEYDQIMERWDAKSAIYKGATINVATQQ